MKVVARGWQRDCGANVIADMDLSCVKPQRQVDTYRSDTVYISNGDLKGEVVVSWRATIGLSGNYLCELKLDDGDILQLAMVALKNLTLADLAKKLARGSTRDV